MTFNDYLKIFIENDFPLFLQKYLYTDTMRMLRYRSQFCGCDYTKFYNPSFLYTRFNHSIIVALINYHFTHDKKSTIASLLHDRKTPCFAHVIDYVLGDYEKQESSEEFKKYPLVQDKELLRMLKGLKVLDNKGELELGFTDEKLALKFVQMVLVYAKELQSNKDKFVMQYLCDVIKIIIDRGLITFEDLYTKPESEILSIISTFPSWEKFQNATSVISSDTKPRDSYSVSIDVKKRNVIPLVDINGNLLRINEVKEEARKIYEEIEEYHDKKYGFVRGLKLD